MPDVNNNPEIVNRPVPILQDDGTTAFGSLPPINKIKFPQTATKSGLIRWLHVMGYPVKDIAAQLGILYQMARNVITTIPKRAAREDLPPLVIEYLPESDIIEAALDGALEKSLLAGRKERKKDERDVRIAGYRAAEQADSEDDEEGE